MALISRDHLLSLVARPPDGPERPQRTPYPTKAGTLYDGPNPDGSRKRCGSCYKFVASGGCVEVAGEIDPGQVCGLFVWGTPQPGQPVGAPERKVAPAAAGLIATPAGLGTACEICRFFQPDRVGAAFGLCNALGAGDGLPPVVVERLGCCARWEAAGEAPMARAPEPQGFGHDPSAAAIDIDG